MSKPTDGIYPSALTVSSVRRFFLWASVAVCLLLAAASIVTSFFGPATTRAVFTSPAGIAVWAVLAVLLLAGPLLFSALRRPGLLAVHLGPVLILIGAGWNS